MNINFWLNGVNRHAEIYPDTLLIDFLREQGCFSVKRGCETANCGTLYSSYGRSPGTFLQYTCSAYRGKEDCHTGGHAERGAGIWKFPGKMKARNSVVSVIRDLS